MASNGTVTPSGSVRCWSEHDAAAAVAWAAPGASKVHDHLTMPYRTLPGGASHVLAPVIVAAWSGLLAVAIGVVSVAWPNITVGAFVVLFPVYAFLAAGTDTARAFRSDSAGPVAGYLLLALLSLAGGLVALLWPGITALALTIWVAAWALVTGIGEVALAFRRGEMAGERAMWTLTDLIFIAVGVGLAIRPDIGAITLATVFGLFSLVFGFSALIMSAQARRVRATTRRLVDAPA